MLMDMVKGNLKWWLEQLHEFYTLLEKHIFNKYKSIESILK